MDQKWLFHVKQPFLFYRLSTIEPRTDHLPQKKTFD